MLPELIMMVNLIGREYFSHQQHLTIKSSLLATSLPSRCLCQLHSCEKTVKLTVSILQSESPLPEAILSYCPNAHEPESIECHRWIDMCIVQTQKNKHFFQCMRSVSDWFAWNQSAETMCNVWLIEMQGITFYKSKPKLAYCNLLFGHFVLWYNSMATWCWVLKSFESITTRNLW